MKPKQITPEEWKELCELRDALAGCQKREEDAAEMHKAAKQATREAQEAVNCLIDDIREPKLFAKET